MASESESPSKRGRKRSHDEHQSSRDPPSAHRTDIEATDNASASTSDDDDDMGPRLPAEAPKKKRRILPFEKVFAEALPRSSLYSHSFMHKESVLFVTWTPLTNFLVTVSADGVVKFWKKAAQGIEFVKQYQAHNGEIKSVETSRDGRSFASAGADATVKIFDVITFDLLVMLTLAYVPGCICWVHQMGAIIPRLAVSEAASSTIHIYDGRGESEEPLHTMTGLHRSPVHLMAYNQSFDCVISADEAGMLEYWRPDGTHEKPEGVFSLKSATHLFDFKKAKSVPSCLTLSPDDQKFATISFPDRTIRVFHFATGKLYRRYDGSLQLSEEAQHAGGRAQDLDRLEHGRLALEKEVEARALRGEAKVLFDESGHFLVFGSMHGIRVLNTYTNKVVRSYGEDEHFRALNLALYQGQPQRKGFVSVEMGASSNPLLQESESRDPVLVATGVNKVRFYLFTNDSEISKSTRDVQNEKPVALGPRKEAKAKRRETGDAAVLHTTYGDIHIRLFPEAAPKAVENFVTHARSGYYNNTIFHRVIRKFMIQCGDPLGDGTGGESIWGREFEDEFSSLKHDKPFTVSMANAGPNTNSSQFFITTEKTPWLDGKHTIFGRAIQGFDVMQKIEGARTYREKPEEDIRIISIDVT